MVLVLKHVDGIIFIRSIRFRIIVVMIGLGGLDVGDIGSIRGGVSSPQQPLPTTPPPIGHQTHEGAGAGAGAGARPWAGAKVGAGQMGYHLGRIVRSVY